ncbi:tripartite tricarboxylate transporter substrate binding protein [Candidimonas humi]|jgi:tripartite-type tricarboxylate transporter receptor subunit TctC|uniref:Bug family tripartite tricarboxylate transporter substrate binding protein n=1 Tax=Candidimonas humi TaxID=683355 RepID=A0ABV8P1K9_9BURK|nr:tripartite tricarboxylate transporter substrate binding protein [Candidimonas humi]MBV6305626.1 tripartite tricarboxylate transporter substrate binding protein [Candidimonas humi]
MLKQCMRTLAGLLMAWTAMTAHAAAYPDRPVDLIVPFSAGGGNDIVARLLAKHLAAVLKTSVVVENKPGASGNIGMQFVARSAPDGYTLAYVSNTVVINPYLYRKMNFDIQKDFVPVGVVATTPIWILVNPKLPVHNLKELIAYAKAHPGKLSYATPGIGTPHHLAMELLKNLAGIDIVHVPYKGASGASTDVISGQVPVLISTPGPVKGFVQSARLRALASMDAERSPSYPDLPTTAETVPGFSEIIWHGVMAPAGTPAPVVSKLSAAISGILKDPAMQKELAAVDFQPAYSDSQAMAKRLATELGVWRDVTRKAGIKPE